MYSAVTIALLSLPGCRKETPENTAPKVYAGDHQLVFLPVDSIKLKGSSHDMQNNITSYIWKKVSGPVSYNFENGTSLETKVRNLEQGEYYFELTATDQYGLQGSDTIAINVIQTDGNKIFFMNQPWNCPMGCSISIGNINSYVPRFDNLQVFIREVNTTNWIEIHSEWGETIKYHYSISQNTFSLWYWYEDDPIGIVDIKITY